MQFFHCFWLNCKKMGFNLKKILLALLFSTADPLSIKDIQAVVTRYHAEQDFLRKKRARENASVGDGGTLPDASDGGDPEDSAAPSVSAQPLDAADVPVNLPDGDRQREIDDILEQVPTLLTATQIREAMEQIASDLEARGEVYRLLQSAAGFKLAISKDYAEWVRLLRNDPRPQRLSRAALETLAIIAYRQPVTRAEIEAIRGVNADGAITRLTEKDLIYISGRADLPGRPLQYSTTSAFLDFIGVNSLEELPVSDVLSPDQISDWIRRASAPAPKDADVGLPEEHSEDGASAANGDGSASAGDAADSGDGNA